MNAHFAHFSSGTKRLGLGLAAVLAATSLIGCAASPSRGYNSPGTDYPASAKSSGYDDAPMPDSHSYEASGQSGVEAPPAPPPSVAPQSEDVSSHRAPSRTSSSDPFELKPKPRNRPGLATKFGEQRFSRVTTAPFVRADRLHPFAMGKLFYNDPQGIAAMTDSRGAARQHRRRFSVGSGHVELGLRDGNGRFLTGFVANGSNYVTGMTGRRYSIVVRNHSPGRIEAVVSVDGLDVIDGKSASFGKRGYLIEPHGDLEIDGFRTSTTKVAAFRFGSVQSSYAARKHGDTRNVGVIGLALFHERGDSPRFWATPRTQGDVLKRHDANPFPQKFATPPN